MRLALTVLLLAALSMMQPTARADDDAAPAQKLIDRAIEAMGGKDALAKTKNSITEDAGTYYGMGEGLPYTGRYVMSFDSPGRYRMEITDVFVIVADGDKAWMSAAGTTTEMEGIALDVAKEGQVIAYAMSLIPLQTPNDKFKLSLADPETVEGEPCDTVRVNHDDMPTLTIWFSKKTGLMRKMKHKTRPAELEFQEVEDETVFQEYGEFDGVKTPTKMTMYRAGEKFLASNYQKVTYPATVDASEFKKPE